MTDTEKLKKIVQLASLPSNKGKFNMDAIERILEKNDLPAETPETSKDGN